MAPSELKPRICCLDLDTFFVSVERLLDPSLEGKPVVVGGRPGQRGVVTACSYEVRKFGVHSGMSLRDAGKLAPHAIYLPPRLDTYGRYAAQVREVAARFSPEIQVASIDEMYMSFEGCEGLYRKNEDESGDQTIERVVRELTATIKSELGLPASAGIATTKSMAKVASGLAKPAGVLMVPAGTEADVLAPLSVRKLPGIGPVSEAKLASLGISTLGELAARPVDELRKVFGAWAPSIKSGALGAPRSLRTSASEQLGRERPAFREHDTDGLTLGSISNERTFREDVHNPEVLASMLCSLCERVCWRARKRGVKARTVTLKLRYSDFETLNRSRTLPPTDSDVEVHAAIEALFLENRTRQVRVRLLGVALSNLVLDSQLSLLPDRARLHQTVDEIRERFGYDAVRLALGAGRGKGR